MRWKAAIFIILFLELFSCKEGTKKQELKKSLENEAEIEKYIPDSAIVACGDITIYKNLTISKLGNNKIKARLKILANGEYFRKKITDTINFDNQANKEIKISLEVVKSSFIDDDCSDMKIINAETPATYLPLLGILQVKISYYKGKEIWVLKLYNIVFKTKEKEQIVENEILQVTNDHLIGG